MKIGMNLSNDEFAVARNEPSPRFVSNGNNTKGDVENLQGNGYEKDMSARNNLNKGRRRRDLTLKALSL